MALENALTGIDALDSDEYFNHTRIAKKEVYLSVYLSGLTWIGPGDNVTCTLL